MGIKQFTASLADFNQAQLDQISANVTTVQTAVNDLKNTDVSQLSAKVLDYRGATKYKRTQSVTVTANVKVTLLTVTGKGYLRYALAGHATALSESFTVTIDGVAYNWTYDAGGVAGFGPLMGGNMVLAGMATVQPQFTDRIESTVRKVAPTPEFFQTSLVIELVATQSGTFGVAYDCGVFPT